MNDVNIIDIIARINCDHVGHVSTLKSCNILAMAVDQPPKRLLLCHCDPFDIIKMIELDIEITFLIWSPCGSKIIVGFVDGLIRIFNDKLERIGPDISSHSSKVIHIMFSRLKIDITDMYQPLSACPTPCQIFDSVE